MGFMGDRHYNGPLLLAQEMCQFALTEKWARGQQRSTCTQKTSKHIGSHCSRSLSMFLLCHLTLVRCVFR